MYNSNITVVRTGIIQVTRPADVTPYSAKDAIAISTTVPLITTIPGIVKLDAGSGYITKVRAYTNQSTNVARLRLHIFNDEFVPAVNDNAAYTALLASMDKKVGFIDLPAMQTSGAGSDIAYAEVSGIKIPFQCKYQRQDIYFLIETLDAFTPASGQNFYFEFSAEVYRDN